MRLAGRFISREAVLAAVDTYQLVEAYPDDKYLPSSDPRAARVGGLPDRPQGQEAEAMRCEVCGAELTATKTDLPFKVRETGIVILKTSQR